jgi:hypothetical protein
MRTFLMFLILLELSDIADKIERLAAAQEKIAAAAARTQQAADPAR